jgi:hypothetical protein
VAERGVQGARRSREVPCRQPPDMMASAGLEAGARCSCRRAETWPTSCFMTTELCQYLASASQDAGSDGGGDPVGSRATAANTRRRQHLLAKMVIPLCCMRINLTHHQPAVYAAPLHSRTQGRTAAAARCTTHLACSTPTSKLHWSRNEVLAYHACTPKHVHLPKSQTHSVAPNAQLWHAYLSYGGVVRQREDCGTLRQASPEHRKRHMGWSESSGLRSARSTA